MVKLDNLTKPVVICTEPGAQQNFREECDINFIMNRYQSKGILPDLIRQNPQYGDFTSVNSYQDSLNLVTKAQEQFAALPSEVRSFFSNNPSNMLEYVNNPKNGDKLIELGLAVAVPVELPNDDITSNKATQKAE